MGQMFDDPKALIITAGILLVMGIVPGMSHFAFLTLGAIAAGGAYWQLNRIKKKETEAESDKEGNCGVHLLLTYIFFALKILMYVFKIDLI